MPDRQVNLDKSTGRPRTAATVGRSKTSRQLTVAWPVCVDCEERHDPRWDCRTYGPRCQDCGRLGDRRFREVRPGVLRDVLAPSLGPDALECSMCESVNITMEVVDA